MSSWLERRAQRNPPPAYPSLGDPLDRRRFLVACARAALVAGSCLALSRRGADAQEPPDNTHVRGRIAPPDWPQPQVRLIGEEPIEVTFRDGATGHLAVAIVLGPGPEPTVDVEALRAAVREVAAGFDSTVLATDDARATLEAAIRARLDDILKAIGASVDAATVVDVPAPPREEQPAPAERRRQAAPSPEPVRAPAALPRARGRCLIHGDGPCPER